MEGGIRANRNDAKGGGENKYGERGVVRRLCTRGDVAEPGVPRESLVTAIGEEDARSGDQLEARQTLQDMLPSSLVGEKNENPTYECNSACHLAENVDRE